MKKIVLKLVIILIVLLSTSNARAQAILEADGPGNTYELINSVLAPSGNVVENPECVHPEFGRHVAEVWDNDLGKYVFEFYIHVTPDNDRCINFDRQRMEIKTYNASPDNLIGVYGESVTYKWKFKLPGGFQPSSNFTHVHQIKAVGGDESDPIFTLTARKGSPNKLELIHDNTTKVTTANLSAFLDVWVECTEIVHIDSINGTYSMSIKRVSDGTTLLSFSKNKIMTIRSDNSFIRPKWGIYRSLLSSSNLRDEAVRFAGFYIGEETSNTLPAAPSALIASVVSSTQIDLSWNDNSSNEEQFEIERSTDGSNWSFFFPVSPNATSYSDSSLLASSLYYYRIRSENSFGNSNYSNTVYASTNALPVELTSFIGKPNEAGVELKWVTATEINNYGFEIERRLIESANWMKVGFVKGSGSSLVKKNYSFSDKNISVGKYFYRLKQIDFDGKIEYSKVVEIKIEQVGKFNLVQNYTLKVCNRHRRVR